ncbi:hypothetical protein PILCRDRAFT_821695 [Piloderma croceum F 1598]|uniref:Uncharacterized protein n=1 Tax=Piloderma croceum (strain F 1598) TaxID=765440 RepID=A0A0C3F9C4_PILCF|nr:hypothetical protein PILCRDRAFT_821695 [Piloderma croceum F 1598]
MMVNIFRDASLSLDSCGSSCQSKGVTENDGTGFLHMAKKPEQMTSTRIGLEHDSQRKVPGHWQDFKSITRRTLELFLRSNSRSEHMSFSADHEVYQSASGSVKSVNESGFA